MNDCPKPAFDGADTILVTVKGDPLSLAGVSRVELDLARFHSGRWAVQLDRAFAGLARPVIVLADGVACLALAWWVQLSPRRYVDAIAGAVFRSPLRIRFGQAAIAASARNGPSFPLPFPSIVASDVAAAYAEQLLMLADGWGSRLIDINAQTTGESSNRHRVNAAEAALLPYLRLFEDQPAVGNSARCRPSDGEVLGAD